MTRDEAARTARLFGVIFMSGGGLALLLLTLITSPAEAGPLLRSIAFTAFAVAQIGIGLAAVATGYLMYAKANSFRSSAKVPAEARGKPFRTVSRSTC